MLQNCFKEANSNGVAANIEDGKMKPTNEAISKELFGYIQPGKCWHEWIDRFESDKVRGYAETLKTFNHAFDVHYVCSCGYLFSTLDISSPGTAHNSSYLKANPDYFTEKGFFIVWKWAQKQNWWYEFIEEHNTRLTYDDINYKYINYETFAREVLDFLERRKK